VYVAYDRTHQYTQTYTYLYCSCTYSQEVALPWSYCALCQCILFGVYACSAQLYDAFGQCASLILLLFCVHAGSVHECVRSGNVYHVSCGCSVCTLLVCITVLHGICVCTHNSCRHRMSGTVYMFIAACLQVCCSCYLT